MRERAYESFTQHLLTRSLRPGQFVSQRELVALTGFPLGAIRELIPRLEADGLIRTVPQRGMQVTHIDLKLIRDAYQLRLFLEREAVAAYARDAADADIARLRRRHLEVLEEAAAGPVTDALVRRAQAVDWELHDTIVDALGNALISAVYRVNSIKIRLIRQERVRIHARILEPVMRDHLAIIDALAARDADAAVAALTAHIGNAVNRALGVDAP